MKAEFRLSALSECRFAVFFAAASMIFRPKVLSVQTVKRTNTIVGQGLAVDLTAAHGIAAIRSLSPLN